MPLPRPLCAALLLATFACGTVKPGGLDAGDGSATDAEPSRPVKTGGDPLPQAGGKSIAVWTSAGGGVAAAANGVLGVTIEGPGGASTVTAPSGATVTLGHFADTLE
jgi:hypothetical protein